MTDLIWSPESIRDLESIRTYIAADSSLYADLVVRRIVAAVERLKTFPESGRIVPERGTPDIREVIVEPYRVVYRLRSGVVEIATVFRASTLPWIYRVTITAQSKSNFQSAPGPVRSTSA